jgi:hypothetical protein
MVLVHWEEKQVDAWIIRHYTVKRTSVKRSYTKYRKQKHRNVEISQIFSFQEHIRPKKVVTEIKVKSEFFF